MAARPIEWLAALTVRALFAAAIWWVLVEGDAAAWAFGIPVVVFAVAVRTVVAERPPPRLRPLGAIRALAVFAFGLVRGGFDVARRALSPGPPLAPGWILHEIRLSGAFPSRLLMMSISMMPGTISTDLDGTCLRIHGLVSTGDGLRRQIASLESSIAQAFGEDVQRRD